MSFLTLSGVQKFYGANAVVKSFDLSVERGEFVTLLGPSGCGKTTTLRMVAGFETPSAGEIRIEGADVTGLPPNKRQIGMVFQAYALFPNMTVAANVGFGLRIAGRPAAEIKARVMEMLAMVKLAEFAERFPHQLSGGQQQRVSLARALAPSPRILLLDEPLSALDARIRVSLREEIRALQRQLKITTIFVSHDQEEALSMSDRVVIMNGGVVEQAGAPSEVYNRPRTRFVASFVGSLNQIEARVIDPVRGEVEIEGQRAYSAALPAGAAAGETRMFALRPEALRLGASETGHNTLEGVVSDLSFLGALIRMSVRVGSRTLLVDAFNRSDATLPAPGSPVTLSFRPEDLVGLEGAL